MKANKLLVYLLAAMSVEDNQNTNHVEVQSGFQSDLKLTQSVRHVGLVYNDAVIHTPQIH